MVRLLAETAARKPGAPALVDETGTTTWASLQERTNRLIHALRAAGLRPGDTVALLTGNRREYFEVMSAGLHAGLFVVPVNWHWVARELAYVLDNSDAVALIVDDRFLPVAQEALGAPESARCRLRVAMTDDPPAGFDAYEALLASGSADEPPDQQAGAPMFYTSGTTGFPKGVRSSLLRAGADPAIMAGLTQMWLALLGLPAEGVALLCGPGYHSAQWAFSMLPLAAGQSVVMRHRFDPAETLELIDRYRVTNLHLVPTQFIRMLKLPDETRAAFHGDSLVAAVHGAAPCPPEVKRQMLAWWGPRITEYYGGTEGGFLTVITGEEWLRKPGSVGRATLLVELFIVKDDGTLAGPNEPGQIYFKSRSGADFHYHKDPQKTQAAHREPGVGTLGDVGYLDEDGYLFLSDRKIDMIISGGVNIYPAEIESVLVTHPAVADAAVFGVPNEEFGEEVKAAVELVPGQAPSEGLAEELIGHVRRHLAGYKAPRSVDFERQLPRAPTGKLMKRLLRDRYWEGTGRTI
jgi:long-chain acyl-CoA synthetase